MHEVITKEVLSDTSGTLTEEKAQELAKDFQISEDIELQVQNLVRQLHALCVENEIPYVFSVVTGKETVPEGIALSKGISCHLSGQRPPEFFHTAIAVLEEGISIPEPLLKLASKML